MLLHSHGAQKGPEFFDEKTPDKKTREKTLVNGASQYFHLKRELVSSHNDAIYRVSHPIMQRGFPEKF